VRVTIPKSLTPRQEELLRELAREEGTAQQTRSRKKAAGAKNNPAPQEEGLLRRLWHSVKEWADL